MSKVKDCLTKIKTMSVSELEAYQTKVSVSNCTRAEKNEIYSAIDARMAKMNRDAAIVEDAEVNISEFFQ